MRKSQQPVLTQRLRSAAARMAAASLALLAATCGGAAPAEQAAEPVIVFPAPVQLETAGGGLALDGTATIVLPTRDERLPWAADQLSQELGRALGAPDHKLKTVDESEGGQVEGVKILLGTAKAGSLARAAVGELASALSDKAGAYVLSVDSERAAILGRDAQGAYYGTLTLLHLFQSKPTGGEILCAKVVDHPYHVYRAMRLSPPRGKPRKNEITHEYFRDFLRLFSLFRLNHAWIQGTSWGIPHRRHPEIAWNDVLTIEQAKAFDRFGTRHFLSMDGSVDYAWLNWDYKHLAELYPDETYQKMRKEVRKRSRLNPCPSNPETWKLLFESIEDVCEILSGDHFAVPLDEMSQPYNGSRWAVCPRCAGNDPVKLWADFASRLTAHVIKQGKTPVMSGGMLLREHQGWYQDIYKAIDLIGNRDKIVIYNWSEGHIRRGAISYKGERLQREGFKTTPFFREHGYKDVMHMLSGRWQGRPELRETNGKLDCYGGFVTYYHGMDHATMKQKGTLASLVFSAQHLWSPDSPAMDSEQDRAVCRYGEALADAVLHHKPYIEAIALARRVYASPGSVLVGGASFGRKFSSEDRPVDLTAKKRGDRTAGEMRIELPVEEANPERAHLLLTLNDWDQPGEGEIYLNGHRVELAASGKSNGRDYGFPPVEIPREWLKFGPDPNVLRFVWVKTAGFKVVRAQIVVSEK
ncbi:MAG: hypothetical protein JXR37_32050 [Kiritimatiellae bacterium]|nr:hypothetical protein [Kiritimatiellia bacterium]